MTDRELLELAAKAAGIELHIVANENGSMGFYQYPSLLYWNPLDDDGDALRLAVRLRLKIEINNQYTWIDGDRDSGSVSEYASMVSTPEQVTRRAIVRAAAEIGREILNKF